ncbi:aspartate kinase [Streptomyces sp. SID3343]|uniref:aspartate kinase n=1 Tax=Streptomyces sp. SID3343 TaxID=2690260 RepID=UPI00136880AC|nr:aspartate kinase [Streptomyces sp. SID3343]MYW01748.1 aspartate kinase [Streptomyces sp. SID3343]
MVLIVQKYGGSSVAGTDRIRHVAERVVATHREGHDVVVVLSAMGDTTDELLDLARQFTPLPNPRELDVLCTAGERISNALAAIAIRALGERACSLSGPQAGVFTTAEYGNAQIVEVSPQRIRRELDRGAIVLVAGFQGLNRDTDDITTLGRGGSDTTAIALAAALKADVCEIYTDVDGVYSADPRIVPNAALLDHITYEAMQEMAAAGSKVLALRSVEYARRCGVPIHVRSSFGDKPGTLVSASTDHLGTEQSTITGVAHDLSGAKVTVTGVPNHPGTVGRLVRAVADAGGEIDMVVQNAVRPAGGRTDVTFVLPREGALVALAALRETHAEIGFEEVSHDADVGKVSVIGTGMRAGSGATATFCETLAAAGVNVEIMSMSEIGISVLCRSGQVADAVRALHTAFDLDTTEAAPVHAVTGR